MNNEPMNNEQLIAFRPSSLSKFGMPTASGDPPRSAQDAVVLPLRVAAADYRHNCGRLLFRGVLMEGSHIAIRCPKCGKMAVYEAKPLGVMKVDEPVKEALTLAAAGI